MTEIMTYLSAFGLASGAGAKAFIPVLMLGGLHYTRYFELSEKFSWIADPAVMTILAVLVVLEVVVDAHPDLGQFADEVAYLPKFAEFEAPFKEFEAYSVTGKAEIDNLPWASSFVDDVKEFYTHAVKIRRKYEKKKKLDVESYNEMIEAYNSMIGNAGRVTM